MKKLAILLLVSIFSMTAKSQVVTVVTDSSAACPFKKTWRFFDKSIMVNYDSARQLQHKIYLVNSIRILTDDQERKITWYITDAGVFQLAFSKERGRYYSITEVNGIRYYIHNK